MTAGRPTDFKPEYVEQAEKLCLMGATDNDLADFFDVHVATIYRWKHSQPEFCEALKVGKEALDNRVERSLYHRAVGYTFDSEKIMAVSQGKDLGAEVQRIPYKEHIPPDTTAAIFWLKNRRSQAWRDKQEVEHSGSIAVNIDTDHD